MCMSGLGMVLLVFTAASETEHRKSLTDLSATTTKSHAAGFDPVVNKWKFPVDVAAEARCSGTMEVAGVGTGYVINSPGGNVLEEGNGIVSRLLRF